MLKFINTLFEKIKKVVVYCVDKRLSLTRLSPIRIVLMLLLFV